ncbi:unnamed protein product (macronuclear) [Paramecium tetraurelia]|uniref:non-specific serine/threonine protein kinase n=1 Tax=Paramecium tetraurelia TaxID=5888 RepID=A0DSY0_PARTE|nr:uncharacterized protein GSPATT00019840001 [Paramecium tetraurelia]CAK86147.1 unnamed protein product [Paramecium tetraurelia]|eukprot:XP_001453544.1 hypothetical protein (macronuclear) [Paramecium tetraurelia strain d4-2]
MQTEQYFFDSAITNRKNQWVKIHSIKRPISTIRLFEGTLFIKSKKHDLYKPKFFKLFSDRLNIYKVICPISQFQNCREQKETAALFLTNVYLDLSSQNIVEKDGHSIVLFSGSKKYYFRAKSQEQKQKWIEHFIKTCILNNYRDIFLNLKVIGKGTYAKVLLAQRKVNQSKYAVKTFQKSALLDKNNKQRQGLLNEIDLLRSCDHPNIIKLYEIYESGDYIYLVMELLEGGELFDLILETQSFQESKVALIMFKIFDALEYLHTKNIMHRDIKPENILLKDKSENFEIKIADFGLASYTEADLIIARCGTPGYVAPEIFEDKKYNEKVDVFSAGIILYILLSGQAPFFGNSLDEIMEKNRDCQINFKDLKVSEDALDLLKKSLEPNPECRISSLEALSHPFISHLYKRESNHADDIKLNNDGSNEKFSILDNMKKFGQCDLRSRILKCNQNELIQQTPFLGVREYDPIKASSDSWLLEKSSINDSNQLFRSPNIQQQQSDSDCSILSSPDSKKETSRQLQFSALQQITFRQPPNQSLYPPQSQYKSQLQMNLKKANQIRDQLKKLG